MNYPKISIVTPSFNQGEYLEETITSVINQNYPNLEYVIIDGGSTDNSLETIKKYASHFKYWTSEPDNGQADAINKGLKHCTGDIFNWINSDDYIEQGALFKIAEAFTKSNADLIAGGVRVFDLSTEEISLNKNLSAKNLLLWKNNVNFIQPGVWLKREKVLSCGGIDPQFHYSFDWDLYIRYLYYNVEVKEVNDLLVHFRLHDSSKTNTFHKRFINEQILISEKLASTPGLSRIHSVCKNKYKKHYCLLAVKQITNTPGNRFFRIAKLLKLLSTNLRYTSLLLTLSASKRIILNQIYNN